MATPRQVPILRARIEQARVVWAGIDGKRFDALKRHLEGQDVELTLQKRRKKRSLKQNSYYWPVVVGMIQEAAGYLTDEEAHDALRMHFLQKHEDGQLPTVRSTTELTTVEFEEYLSKCRQLGAEMYGIYIPEPNEVMTTQWAPN
jgi:hypothetical protein